MVKYLLLYDTNVFQSLSFAGPFVDKALCLVVGDGDGCSVARSEDVGICRVAHVGEVGEVSALAVLVVTIHVAVIHKDPLVRVDELEYSRALYSLLALLQVLVLGSPLTTQSLGGSLLDTVALAFGLEEHVVQAVGIHDVSVDGVGVVVIEYFGQTDFGEVLIGI